MKQVGKVISIDGEYATLKVHKMNMCGENCGACKGGCKPSEQEVRAGLGEGVEISVGDMAVLELETKKILATAAVTYLLPVAALFIGYGAAFYLTKSEPISIVSALGASVLVLFSAKLLDKHLKNNKKYEITITKVLH